MKFDFLQKKVDAYTTVKANELFDKACDSLMRQSFQSVPLVCKVTTNCYSEPHIIEQIVNRVKDNFLNVNMRAEIVTESCDSNSTTFIFNIFEETFVECRKIVDYFWSRRVGEFVNETNGNVVVLANAPGGSVFTGTVREWYETLVETVIDAGDQITMKCTFAPNVIRCGPDIATIFECSVAYRPKLLLDNETSPYIGTLCNRFNVIKDPNMARNQIEISRTVDGVKWMSTVTVLGMGTL